MHVGYVHGRNLGKVEETIHARQWLLPCLPCAWTSTQRPSVSWSSSTPTLGNLRISLQWRQSSVFTLPRPPNSGTFHSKLRRTRFDRTDEIATEVAKKSLRYRVEFPVPGLAVRPLALQDEIRAGHLSRDCARRFTSHQAYSVLYTHRMLCGYTNAVQVISVMNGPSLWFLGAPFNPHTFNLENSRKWCV